MGSFHTEDTNLAHGTARFEAGMRAGSLGSRFHENTGNQYGLGAGAMQEHRARHLRRRRGHGSWTDEDAPLADHHRSDPADYSGGVTELGEAVKLEPLDGDGPAFQPGHRKPDLLVIGDPPQILVEGAYDREPTRYERWGKPVVDRVGAVAALLLFGLPMLVIAAAILVTMGRPVLFRQPRVGREGRIFEIYKFRTMLPDRRQRQEPFPGPERRRTHKQEEDPRVTRLGRFLRAWSLDELPQFLNVVKGDMSLVGPRPELVDIVTRFEGWQHRRHAVKPGVTGLWQISERGLKLAHECVEADLEYLERLSPTTDLQILVATPVALAMRRGI